MRGDPGPWISVDELRRWVNGLVVRAERYHSALPPYLLDRESPRVREARVIWVAGDVRNHVSTEELEEWANRLEQHASTRLQVLLSNSRECIPNPGEEAVKDAHLAWRAELYAQAHADDQMRTEQIREAARFEREAELERLICHGCGGWGFEDPRRRMSVDGAVGSRFPFHEGDIVYEPPIERGGMHKVAVVVKVCADVPCSGCYCAFVSDCNTATRKWQVDRVRLGGDPGFFPTGDMTIAVFDTHRLCFDSCPQRVRLCGLQLLPPCCGRGAACDLAFRLPEHRQWPNGDHLDLRILQALPTAFISR